MCTHIAMEDIPREGRFSAAPVQTPQTHRSSRRCKNNARLRVIDRFLASARLTEPAIGKERELHAIAARGSGERTKRATTSYTARARIAKQRLRATSSRYAPKASPPRARAHTPKRPGNRTASSAVRGFGEKHQRPSDRRGIFTSGQSAPARMISRRLAIKRGIQPPRGVSKSRRAFFSIARTGVQRMSRVCPCHHRPGPGLRHARMGGSHG